MIPVPVKLFTCLFILLSCFTVVAQIPKPDHVVVTVFENRSYEYIKSNQVKAQYLNSLMSDTNVALFTQSYALMHPSQPNYLMLYSGSSQGVTTDSVPDNLPFNSCNLGANLIAKGFSIKGYSESLPSTGYLGSYSGPYLKRHNPVAYWQGAGTNNTSQDINRPYSDFPSDYNSLPDVAFVIPNIYHNMHDGSTEAGDQWFEKQLKPYLDWAKNNNSLLIFTFDEDDSTKSNHILTFFYGPMVKGGEYGTKINHYDILRTIEEMYGVEKCGHSAAANAIDYIWKGTSTGSSEISSFSEMKVFPVPAEDEVTLTFTADTNGQSVDLLILDLTGRTMFSQTMLNPQLYNTIEIPVTDLTSGIYFLNINVNGARQVKKIIVD